MNRSFIYFYLLSPLLLHFSYSQSQSEYQLLPKKKYNTTRTSPIINKVILMFEQNDQFTLNFDCGNVQTGMVAYGEVYDSLNKRIEEFEPVFTTLEAGQMNFELVFNFKLLKNNYSISIIKSAYVKIFLGRKMSMGNKPVAIGQDYLFSRSWQINESENSFYKSKLLPIGKLISQLPAPKLIPQVPKVNKKPSGPGYQADTYLQGSYLNNASDLFSIGNVYEDATDSSGVFYYLPTLYSMYDSKTGIFNLDIQNGQGINIDKTYIIATPKPIIDPEDIDILKNRIKTKISYFKELRKMPIEKIEADIKTLPSDVKDHVIIPPDKIDDPVYIKFSTTSFEEILSQLFKNKGLVGNIHFEINSPKSISRRTSTFNLSLVDPITTYGRIHLDKSNWRNTEMKNPTFNYSIKLEKFNILYETDDDLAIYSWSMDSGFLPSKSKLVLDPSLVPAWIDSDIRTKKIWIDYSVPECISCNDKVKEKITSKLEKGRKRVDIIAQTFDAFKFTNAQQIRIKLSSYQLNASGTGRKEESDVTFIKDQESKSLAVLYVPEGRTLSYDYMIEVLYPDSQSCKSNWISGNDRNIYLGSVQFIEKMPCLRK